MKHRHSNRILGRVASSRGLLLRNLGRSLIKHGAITTTEAKAKELRRFIEPLLTRAQAEETLAVRRHIMQYFTEKDVVDAVFALAKATKGRKGGFVRLTRLPSTRQDSAKIMRVDIIDKVASV